MISPKLISVELNRVEYIDLLDRKSIDRSDRNVMMGWRTDEFVNGVGEHTLTPDKCKGSDNGRFPTQLFTNIKNDRYKYVKNIT